MFDQSGGTGYTVIIIIITLTLYRGSALKNDARVCVQLWITAPHSS